MFEMSDKVKNIISKKTGASIEELIQMDIDAEKDLVEEKTGKKLRFPDDVKTNGLRLRTIEYVDKKLEQICKKRRE